MKAELNLTPFDLEELQLVMEQLEQGETKFDVLEKYIESNHGSHIYLKINLIND